MSTSSCLFYFPITLMKRFMNIIFIIIYVSILTLVSLYFFKKWNIWNKEIQQPVADVGIVDPSVFFTWLNSTWVETTWNTIVKPPSNIEIFNDLENRKTIQFTVQPTEYNWKDFADRTKMLVDYAKNNMQTIIIPQKIKWWYLYIKLRKNLPAGRSAVIYIKAGSWYCWGWLKQMGYTYNNNEYLYKLTNVPLIASNCGDNRIPKIIGQTISIWGYVWTFDWNWIQEITVARY